jgi:hypothetical protein
MNSKISSVRAVTIARAHAGVEYWSTLKEADKMQLDYLIFNGALVSVALALKKEKFWTDFPEIWDASTRTGS